tara:strand:- start:147 stop:419 length:273 start_codon:yes stop_codon:yes gene_type:complete
MSDTIAGKIIKGSGGSQCSTNWDYMMYASGFYLTENLPRESFHWEEDKLDTFLEDHLCEPFEYHDANQIWEHILILGSSLEDNFIWRHKR